jgi:hypothetical protein
MAPTDNEVLPDVGFDPDAESVLVLSNTTAGFVDDLSREAKGMKCSRSAYVLTILTDLGEQGRLDAYVAAKRNQASRVVAAGRGLDV